VPPDYDKTRNKLKMEKMVYILVLLCLSFNLLALNNKTNHNGSFRVTGKKLAKLSLDFGPKMKRTDPNAVKAVLAGRRNTAAAAWWGFNKDDATKCLQAAINSGAKKVIVANMGTAWIVGKIKLASNQEIVFEQGTIVMAPKGGFKGKFDAMFSASDKKNITIKGYGATIMMRKKDYQDKTKYTLGQWRHALSIRGCDNVKIYGLTIKSSGGDGIYIGAKTQPYCKNVHIKDVVCDDNVRQGISVIGAVNLLIEDSVLKNTAGHKPAAGIDFEPNTANNPIVNCVMRNCLLENNAGYGVHIYLIPLDKSSRPVSLRVENCLIKRNHRGGLNIEAHRNRGIKKSKGYPQGVIEVVNCKLEENHNLGIIFKNKPADSFRVRIDNCTLKNNYNKPSSRQSPIVFFARPNSFKPQGGVKFSNCTVIEKFPVPLISYSNWVPGLDIAAVKGQVTFINKNKTKTVDIAAAITALRPKRVATLRQLQLPYKKYLPLTSSRRLKKTDSALMLRGSAKYLLYARRGEKVKLYVAYLQAGKQTSKKQLPIAVTAPSGRKVKVPDVSFQQTTEVSFIAPETGTYTLFCRPHLNIVSLDSSTHSIALCPLDDEPIRLFNMNGRKQPGAATLYFWVPQGVPQLTIYVSGSRGETLSAALISPTGNTVDSVQHIDMPQPLSYKFKTVSKGEVWTVQLSDVVEDMAIYLFAPVPPVMAFSPEKLLIPKK
jgi:hypothetical protein